MVTRSLMALGLALVAAGLLITNGATARVTAATNATSLPSVSSGARPGPDVLYAPPPAASQLENRNARFNAAPLLVSGTEAYVDGEYLYQDYLYDDYGSDTDGAGCQPLSSQCGDIAYPTNFARYGGNAADIVEFRIDSSPDSVAYRITLNTLLEQNSTMIAIAYDTDRNTLTGVSTLPRDPGAPFPGTDQVIFAWGAAGEVVKFGLLQTTTTPVLVTTDLQANQITIVVPRSVSNPTGVWRTTVAAGLYDTATGGWLRPGLQASATQPGGAGPLDPMPSGIFNLAFRFNEPMMSSDTPADTTQAAALRAKTPTTYAHDIDFGALAAHQNSTTVPAHGTQVRIFPSRLQLGEGRDLNSFPGYLGQLQPYALYIPSSYTPGTPAGLTLDLHSLGEHYWQYNGSNMVQQIGEQRGNFVATSLSRGDDGWYQHEAEYDVFEMWNDIANHFTLDADHTAISGYSMGGFATYRLGTLYPDLFGKAMSVVGPPGDGIWVPPAPPTGSYRGDDFGSDGRGTTGAPESLTNSVLENVRNLPYMNLVGVPDELVPIAGTRAQNLGAPEWGIKGFDQLGYRFHYLVFPTSDHLLLAIVDDYPMAPRFLADSYVDRNPAHVTFSYMPATDDSALGLVHDHAYWVSDLALNTNAPFPAKGTIDAFSHAFGVGDPTSTSGQQQGTSPLPHQEFYRDWNAAPTIPVANRLDVTLTNLGAATVDVARAGINACQQITLSINSDGAARLLLAGVNAPQSVTGANYETSSVGVTLVLGAGNSTVTIAPNCYPDLQVTSITWGQTGASTALFRATITNTSSLPAPATQTEFRLDGASLIISKGTPALGPGQSVVIMATWVFAGQSGAHTITASADAQNEALESNETNNARSVAVTVQNGTIH